MKRRERDKERNATGATAGAAASGVASATPQKLRVALLFGGRSGEHEVSLRSGASVLKALDLRKYEVVPVGITRDGRWLAAPALSLAGGEASLARVLERGRAVTASVEPSGAKLIPLDSAEAGPAPAIDVVFPVLHGTYGEDGTVQGLLEMADIPYVGAGVLASSVGMDKDVMKRLFRDAGLPVVDWLLVGRHEWQAGAAKVRRQAGRKIGYPLFVKPANLGSSVGITKVHKPAELGAAIDMAASYDRKIIVEKAIDAREIECSVLGNDQPEASVAGEIVSVNEFYDYEAKYVKEGSQLIIPARLTARQARWVREMSLAAFKAIDAAGMARVDFLLDRRNGRLYLNEINTIPGFTSISMYPKLWEASGVSYPRLIDRLIQLAMERHKEKAATRYDYPQAMPAGGH